MFSLISDDTETEVTETAAGDVTFPVISLTEVAVPESEVSDTADPETLVTETAVVSVIFSEVTFLASVTGASFTASVSAGLSTDLRLSKT